MSFSKPPAKSIGKGNPFFLRENPRDKGTHGRKAEVSAATRLRATLKPGSGALDGAKGDYSTADFLIENKATTAESFSVKLDVWAKIYAEAQALNLHPALAIQFVTPAGVSARDRRLVAIPEWLFHELVNKE